VNKSGFGQAKAEGIEVRVTETTRVTITLKPGAVSEKVEVSAQVSTVETTNATTGESIGTSTIRELPLATQNYQQLLTLSSGAQSELNASAQLGRGNVRVIVNGQREDNNNYLIEGISATDYNVAQATNVPLPNPDVIQEFKVQTSLYDASQGRNGGGNVNAILKSGTKEFHGDVYEFFRNDVLNANEFFLNAAGQKRPSIKQNIFGGSVGGPVGKEKFGFFFVNYQGTRQRSALSPGTQINNPAFPSLPTGRSAASIAAALSTASFPITAADIDPVALALLQFQSNQFGDPNGFLIPSVGAPNLDPAKAAYVTAPFIATKPGKYTDDQFTANWDREFGGGRDKLSVRFFFSDAESLLPFGAGGLQASLGGTLASSISATDLNFPYDLPVAARFFTVGETHLFSPTLVNDFRFGYVRINNSLLNIPPVTAADLGINRPTNNVTQSIYKFTLGSSGFQIGPTPPADQFQTQNNYNFVDTVSWVRGAHVWRFGGDFTRVNLDKLFPQVFNGQLFFVNSTGGATDFQKLLVGAPDFSFGGGGVFNHQYRTNDFSVFGQDDWRVRRNLTLNLGLRVEVLGGFHDDKCHIVNLDQDLANSGKYPFIYGGCVKGLNLAGLSATGSDTTYKNNYTTGLAPRIGFAYDLGGHQTTTIRGGYGIYFAREDVGTVDQLSFQAPFLPVAFAGEPAGSLANFFLTSPNALPQGGILDPNFVPCLGTFAGFVLNGTSTPTNDATQTANYGCANGSPGVVPSQFLFGLTVPRHFIAPNTQQWNLTLQRALGRQWVFEVGYVGTHAVHLRETRTSIQARLASPSNPIVLTDTSGNTALNTAFNDESTLDASRGLSDFDRPHRFVVSYRYDLPWFSKADGWKHAVLANWAISGITIFQSGTPFSVTDSAAGSAFLGPGLTPLTLGAELAPGGSISAGRTSGSIQDRVNNGYLNLADFTTAPLVPASQGGDGVVTFFGNLARNIYRGPFQQSWDFSLIKNIKITERQQLRFTSDFFNIWNHANFANPALNDVENPGAFGKIFSTVGTPRLIQFSLRYAF